MKTFLRATWKRGSALILALGLLLIAAISIGSLLSYAVYQLHGNARYEIYTSELNAAEYAMNSMLGQIKYYAFYKPTQVGGQIGNFHNAVLNVAAPPLAGYQFSESGVACAEGGDLEYREITDPADPWNGYPTLRIVYELNVRAKRTDPTAQRLTHPGVKLRRRVQIDSVPLYVFGIFYNNLLEIWPGPQFDMYGKVHSNQDLYLGGDTGANYHESVSSAGQLYAGKRAPGSGQTDNNSADKVKIKDKVSGTLKNMLDGGNPIDYAQLGDQWVAKALARWNRNARDKHFGVKPMQVAIPETSDPHVLIERASSSDQPGVADMKFENKADLRIVRQSSGTVAGFDKNGNSVSLTYVDSNHVTQSVYKETTFYNEREGKTVRCLELDIGKLIASGINLGQGLIYMSESPSGSQQPGVRITNGATLPTTLSGGFTLATDDPLYIKGNFNTGSNHINALLSGDAINILSNAWQDSQNASHDTTVRSASATETNALFLSGNVPSGGNKYSGGAENFFRYSEDWSGVTHKFRGSLLNLFQSTVATGTWTYGSPVYNAPNRDWGWDTVYSGINPPPGMVDVFVLKTTRWEVVGSSS